MLVVDASALVSFLADDGDTGERARSRLRGESLRAPELIDVEVLSALRRLTLAQRVDERRARQALGALGRLSLRRARHAPLLGRCWELRGSISAYDATYVALAERLDAILVTQDRRLAGANGPRCTIEVLSLESSGRPGGTRRA